MGISPEQTLSNSAAVRRAILPLLLVGLVLAGLFHLSFQSGQVHSSNDAPLGALQAYSDVATSFFSGAWHPLYWFGGEAPAALPNVTYGSYLVLGPVLYAKFYPPISLFLLGLATWLFCRQLRFGTLACTLAGLAAALNSDALSNACWGLPSWITSRAMLLLALAVIVAPQIRRLWVRAILAGFCVGLAVMEGYDVGAIFSLYAAAFVFFYLATTQGKWEPVRAIKSICAVALVAVSAAWIAALALSTLVGTQVKGVVGTEQTEDAKKERWAFATSGSLPKMETLRVIIPGLFGYRMDTPNGGEYWGAVNRNSQIEEMLAKAKAGSAAEISQLEQFQGNSGPFRHSGSGEYAGILVVLLAVWAFAQSLRGGHSPYTAAERRLIWFWAGAAIVSLLLAFGRYAPFYQFVYQLPYFSTIRNPIKFMQPFQVSVIILFAYGVEDLSRRYLTRNPGASSLFEQLKRWWSAASAFDQRWTIGLGATLGAAVLGTLMFATSRPDLLKHLQLTGFKPEQAPLIADFATQELLWFILFLGLSASTVVAVLSGALGGSRAKWAGIFLGLILVTDLSRANSPWIRYENYREKYRSNAILDFLSERPYEHRVTMGPNPGIPEIATFHQGVYHALWLQHHFPYYGIQSLDIPQEPRVAQEKLDYVNTLSAQPARYWQLSNTRYLFGVQMQLNTPLGLRSYVDLLNDQLDPQARRFRLKSAFNVSQAGPDSAINAVLNEKGPFALIEFTGALPRTKLYVDWQGQPDLPTTLSKLAEPGFDPEQTVLLTGPASLPEHAPGTNATPGTVEITSYAPKQIKLKADAQSPCVLLLNDRYHPDWKVFVDGRSAELLRANYIARGVKLEPGRHEVEFRFEPSAKPLYVSLSAIVCGLILCGFVCFRRSQESGDAPTAIGSTVDEPSPTATAVAPAADAKPRQPKRRKSR